MQLLGVALIVGFMVVLLPHFAEVLRLMFGFSVKIRNRTLLGFACGCVYFLLLFVLTWNGFAPVSSVGWYAEISLITLAFITPLAFWLPVSSIWLYPLSFSLPMMLVGLFLLTGGISTGVVFGSVTFIAGLAAAYVGLKLASIFVRNLTCAQAGRACGAPLSLTLSVLPIQPQLLNLPRQRIAPHAEQCGSFDAPTAGVLQCLSDERALELSGKGVENVGLVALQGEGDLLGEGAAPVMIERAAGVGVAPFGRQVGDLHHACGRHHGEPVAQVLQLAHVAGDVLR